MSRISFFSQFENTERILLNKADELDETRQKLASGNKVQEPSDDPSAVVDINRFSNQLDNIQQIQRNIDNGQTTLENSEGTMGQLSDLLQRARQLAVKGSNDTLEEDARQSIATEVNQRLEEAVTIANTKVGGNYLFSGTETVSDQTPFEVKRNGEGEIIEVNYRGDANTRENKVSQGRTVATNIPGNRLFQATNQGIVGDYEFESAAELEKTLSETLGFEQIDTSPSENLTANANDPNKTVIQVSDASQFKVGETVKVYDSDDAGTENDYEETVITGKPGGNQLELDLRKVHEPGENPVIESKSSDVTQNIANGAAFGGDAPASVSVSDATTFEVGDKVKISEGGTSETRVVQNITGPNTIEVDLANNYTTSATVERVASEESPNGEGRFEIDGEKFYYNTRNDSILDIARRINERGIEVQAKFVEDKQPQPEAEQGLTADVTSAPAQNVSLSVDDSSNFKEGQKVVLEDSNNSETALIQGIDDSTNTITVDALQNNYSISDGASIRTKAIEEPQEFTPEEVQESSQDRSYKFMLESRVPHQIALKDFDRRPDASPNEVEGLLNDLQILGDGEGGPPAPSEDENHPNSYHKDATVKGKSIFDAMVDLREALQQPTDPDGDTDELNDEFKIPKGNAQRDAYFDPSPRETINESIGDLSSAIENVSINRSIGGARLNRLETADTRAKDYEVNTKELLSQIRDADLAKVITDLRRQQSVQQAALRMAAEVNQQSLANFI